MRRLWTEDRVTTRAGSTRSTDAGIGVKPIRSGGPPLYIAAQAEVSVAARGADRRRLAHRQQQRIGQDRAADADLPRGADRIRPHPQGIPDHRRMLCRRQPCHRARGMPRPARIQIQRLCRLGVGGPHLGVPDFARDRFIIGDKVSVKEEIARYREILGVDHFIMRCQWPGLPQEQALASIKRLGEIFAA